MALRILDLGRCGSIADVGVRHLGNLMSLMSWCHNITDVGVRHLALFV